MTEITILEKTGKFAENKDVARQIRIEYILPSIDAGDDVVLNFKGVDSATQSFIHALISDVIRKRGIDVLDHLFFKNCNEVTQKIVSIVVDYMQDTIGADTKNGTNQD